MGREVDGEGSSSKGKRRINFKAQKAKSILARSCKRPKLQSIPNQKKKKQQQQDRSIYFRINPNPVNIGDTVVIKDLLFSPERDFLVTNNGHKVGVDELKGKTVVLYIVPLRRFHHVQWVTVDMIDAYNELLPMGDVEFVFVAAQIYNGCYSSLPRPTPEEEEVYFNHLHSTMPFPTIPFSDHPARQRFAKAFKLETFFPTYLPYWCIIDPTNTVVLSNLDFCSTLFNMYGGAELYPLTRDRLRTLSFRRYKPRKHLKNLDQLLASPARDFLLSSNGLDKVPISSLKDKVIGLYFCVNTPNPPRMQLINKVYQEAKLRGYEFEIVQINFNFQHSPMAFVNAKDLSVPQCYQNINWLTLPFKDPSCRKLLRIFESSYDRDNCNWSTDCLVIVDCRQPDINGVRFEFSGAEIIEKYGIEGYPFIRQSLFELEWKIQKESVKLKLLFPPGECQLTRRAGDGWDTVDASQLSGKRVLVLFASHSECKSSKYVSMLESKYYAQLRDDKEESKFEMVYVSTDPDKMLFDDCIKDMPPWLVYPHSRDFAHGWKLKIFNCILRVGLVAFDVDGELLAKKNNLDYDWREEYHKLPFPYISQGLEHIISSDVNSMCKLDKYYESSSSVDSDDSDDDIYLS